MPERSMRACESEGLRSAGGMRIFLSGLFVLSFASAHGETAVALRESLEARACTQVRIELKAEGLFRPGLPSGEIPADARMPKPLALDVKTRLVFSERELKVESAGGDSRAIRQNRGGVESGSRRRKVVRKVSQAASAINGDVRPTACSLRPELSLLLAERPAADGSVTVWSPSGPLTRSEMELVEGVGDPLSLADLLPREDVRKGQTWKPGDSAAIALSGYDTVKANGIDATLEQIDESTARIRLKGEVQGSVLGGIGTMDCEGFLTFDRKAGLIDRLELNRTEKRQRGPVEAGLDVKSTLTIIRRPTPLDPELADSTLAKLPLEVSPERLLLLHISSDGKYSFLHDRQWHIYWDDRKTAVLKRLDKGQVIAQCNLTTGPIAGKGRHQDVTRFHDDIRRSLKERFLQFLGAGEVDGDLAGGFHYKVAVQGREGELGVLWYYHLLASPAGDQLLATFTLAGADNEAFGNQDMEMMGSLRWLDPARVKRPSSR